MQHLKEDPVARPITDTLRLLDEGAFLDRCSEQMAALVRGVEDTGKAGKLVITLEVKRGTKGAMLYHDTDRAAMVAAMVTHLQGL